MNSKNKRYIKRIYFQNISMMYSNILIILLTGKLCDSLNILMIFPHFGKSHYFVFEGMAKQLARKGHNISVIVNFQVSGPEEFRIISITEEFQKTRNNSEIISMDLFSGSRKDLYKGPVRQIKFARDQCERLKSSEFQRFIAANNSFDVLVAEVFNTNCFYGLGRIYNAPIVGVSSTDILPWMYQWFGSPENPSYIPVLFLDYADKMTFFQRVENTLMLIYCKMVHKYIIANHGNEYSKKYLGIDIYEDGDIFYNISLLLTNRHFTFQTPKPLSPNIIEVGGIHLREPQELPENLKQLVEESPQGTVFMSMGSTLQGSTFPEEQRKIFLKVFSTLKQRVIWKWENYTMDGIPKNVKIQKWVPQLDLLCHPNVKLFITHGGLLSTQEAVFCGVPMLILPQSADQHFNAAALEKTGAVISLELRRTTSEGLSNALEKILSDEFLKNIKMLSNRFKDRPMSPMDTAIYWIEYVARHKGAGFMKTAVTDMPFYQYLLLDVMGFLLVSVFAFCKILNLIFSNLFFRKPIPKLKEN